MNEYAVFQPFLAQSNTASGLVPGAGSVAGQVTSMLSNTVSGVFNLLVILFIAVFLVVDPRRYRILILHLAPRQQRPRLRRLNEDLNSELRRWMLGRACSMSLVGVSAATGLALLGVPLALTLGLLAGLLSFVPYLGPVLALAPALLIAAVESWPLAGSVLLLYLAIQTIESYVLTPLIQQRTLAIAPAVLIVAQLLGGVLAGALGVLFAAPLTMATVITLRRFRA